MARWGWTERRAWNDRADQLVCGYLAVMDCGDASPLWLFALLRSDYFECGDPSALFLLPWLLLSLSLKRAAHEGKQSERRRIAALKIVRA
jgi:hypothetical protein